MRAETIGHAQEPKNMRHDYIDFRRTDDGPLVK
jgi:hypothetical protein